MSHLNTPPSPTRDHYITQQLTHSAISEERACPICFEDWSDKSTIVRTHCNHTFHRECFVAWLGKEDVNSANSCPSCRAVCFPKIEQQKETGLTLDISFLFRTMRSDYVMKLPARALQSVVSDDEMMRLAYPEDQDDED